MQPENERMINISAGGMVKYKKTGDGELVPLTIESIFVGDGETMARMATDDQLTDLGLDTYLRALAAGLHAMSIRTQLPKSEILLRLSAMMSSWESIQIRKAYRFTGEVNRSPFNPSEN